MKITVKAEESTEFNMYPRSGNVSSTRLKLNKHDVLILKTDDPKEIQFYKNYNNSIDHLSFTFSESVDEIEVELNTNKKDSISENNIESDSIDENDELNSEYYDNKTIEDESEEVEEVHQESEEIINEEVQQESESEESEIVEEVSDESESKDIIITKDAIKELISMFESFNQEKPDNISDNEWNSYIECLNEANRLKRARKFTDDDLKSAYENLLSKKYIFD